MAKHASEASSMELSHYLVVLRRRWRPVVAGVVTGLILAATLILITPSSATSNTLVNVNLISSDAFNTTRPPSDLIDAQTEQTMARSTEVMQGVADEMGTPWTRSSVRQATTATLLPDSTVIRIEFTAPSASAAARGASLVAEQYLAYRSSIAQGRLDRAAEPLEARSDSLKKQLAKKNTQISDSPAGSVEQVEAQMDADELKAELAVLTAEINDLASISTSGGEVLGEADPSQAAISPNRTMIALSGTLGGLLLGLVAAFVVNVLDRRLLDSYDVAGAGGADTLAVLTGRRTQVPASGHDADQIRAVRERLISSIEGERPIFGVIDVGAGDDHPTDVAVGLALSLADAGVATDLVLADYPPRVVDQIASDLRAREIDTHGLGRRFRGGLADHLTVVVPGAARPRISTSDLVAEMLDDRVRAADVTVVAVAPSAGTAIRLTVGRSAHLCVLSVREQDTSIDQLAEVVDDLRSVWAVVHGTVIVPGVRTFEGTHVTPVQARPLTGSAEPAPGEPAPVEPVSVEAAAASPVLSDAVPTETPRDPFTDASDDAESEAPAVQRTAQEWASTDDNRSWAFDR